MTDPTNPATCLACGHDDPHHGCDGIECNGMIHCLHFGCYCTDDDRTIAALRAENAAQAAEIEQLKAEVADERKRNICDEHASMKEILDTPFRDCFYCAWGDEYHIDWLERQVAALTPDAALGANLRKLIEVEGRASVAHWRALGGEAYTCETRSLQETHGRPTHRWEADMLDAALAAAVKALEPGEEAGS